VLDRRIVALAHRLLEVVAHLGQHAMRRPASHSEGVELGRELVEERVDHVSTASIART
jgi:hypothetical protein